MKLIPNLTRTTIILGLIFGLLAVFLLSAARWTFFQYPLLEGFAWISLFAYGVLLAKWSHTSLCRVIFPLILPLLLLILNSPAHVFFPCCLLILSWVRSGICFPGTLPGSLAAEFAICFGGAALIAFLSPSSPLSWALGFWLFFLVQSLYFMFQPDSGKTSNDSAIDPFEKARREAEEILCSKSFGE